MRGQMIGKYINSQIMQRGGTHYLQFSQISKNNAHTIYLEIDVHINQPDQSWHPIPQV